MRMSDLKVLNKDNGYHFFDRQTMKHFNSRIESSLYKDGFFITSEKSNYGKLPREYTIRRGNLETGKVSSVSSFQEFGTLEEARGVLKDIIKYRKENNIVD